MMQPAEEITKSSKGNDFTSSFLEQEINTNRRPKSIIWFFIILNYKNNTYSLHTFY